MPKGGINGSHEASILEKQLIKGCGDARHPRAAPGESWAEGCRYPMEGSGSRGGTSNEQGLGL